MKLDHLIVHRDQFPSTSDVLGFHGTSVEAVSILANTNHFPDNGISPRRFCMLRPDIDIAFPIWYAQQIAVRHFLLGVLPFQVPSHFHVLSAQSLVDQRLTTFRQGDHRRIFDEFMQRASEANITEAKVMQLAEQGYATRHGCLVAISSRMRRDFQVVLDESKIELIIDQVSNNNFFIVY